MILPFKSNKIIPLASPLRPVGLIAQLDRALHGRCTGHGSSPLLIYYYYYYYYYYAKFCCSVCCILLAPVVQRVDSAIQWINYYPLDNAIHFDSTYLRDSDLSNG